MKKVSQKSWLFLLLLKFLHVDRDGKEISPCSALSRDDILHNVRKSVYFLLDCNNIVIFAAE